MKIEHISLSAVVHSTENEEKVKTAIKNFLGFDCEYSLNTLKGHYGNELTYVEIDVPKKQLKSLWKEIIEILNRQEDFTYDFSNRLDDHNILHLRIDKQKAFLGEKVLLTSGDALVLKIKVVTYPARRDKIINELKDLLDKWNV